MTIIATIGLAILLLFVGLTLIFALPRWNKTPPSLRKIPAVEKLDQSISMTVEAGTRIHISLGNADLLSPANGSALSGLASLEKIASISSLGDRKPITTSGESQIAVLSESVSRCYKQQERTKQKTESPVGVLSGTTPLSYAAGAMQVIRKDQVSTNLFLGNYGPEVGLMADASEQQSATTLGASDSLVAQSVLFALTDQPLIGEELFALPVYLRRSNVHQASLRIQDVFRWVVIFIMLVGAFLAFFGIL